MTDKRDVQICSPIAVAPMMDWTDRHCRYFMRLISPDILLYTEMIPASAVLHGDSERLLAFDAKEHPVALQLGGSNPVDLAEAAAIGEAMGYDEINLNVGCPSDRVQSGRFGACLMAEPSLVAECVRAMTAVVSIPITVKTRTGIDDRDDYEFLLDFVDTVTSADCRTIIVHARKAVLSGLSPKQNREIPPLNYDRVRRVKSDRPDVEIIVNGGIRSCDEVADHLKHVDGVMLGREAYHNPYMLARLQTQFFARAFHPPGREAVARAYFPYIAKQLGAGVRLHHMTRHMLGLYNGQPGARRWRRVLGEAAARPGAGIEVVEQSLEHVTVEKPSRICHLTAF